MLNTHTHTLISTRGKTVEKFRWLFLLWHLIKNVTYFAMGKTHVNFVIAVFTVSYISHIFLRIFETPECWKCIKLKICEVTFKCSTRAMCWECVHMSMQYTYTCICIYIHIALIFSHSNAHPFICCAHIYAHTIHTLRHTSICRSKSLYYSHHEIRTLPPPRLPVKLTATFDYLLGATSEFN